MEAITRNKNEIDMTSGNLFKKILFFSLPVMFSGILQLLYNAADLIVCGRFGSEHAVAAISATGALINLIIQLFLGFAVGASVLMSRCYGSNDIKKADKVVHSSILLALIIGFGIGIFGFSFSHTFLIWMKTPNDVISLSSQYLMVYFCGLPFSMIYNFGASLLRATGDTKRPFYFLTFSGLINVLLNLLFVIVFHLDVFGVALATIISQGISALFILGCLLKNKGFCQLSLKKLHIYKAEVIEMIRIGLPAGLQGAIFSLSNVLIQSSVNSLGTFVMDGNGAAGNLEGFVYTCMNSIAQACISFVSTNYGAKNTKNIQKSILYSTLLVVLFGVGIGMFVLLFGKHLLGFYVHSDEAIQEGLQRLTIICSTYFLCGLMDTFAYSLRGLGYSLLPAIVSLCGACGLRILWIYTIFPMPAYHSLKYLCLSYPVSWFITALIHLFCLFILKKKAFKKLTITNE